MNGRGDVEGASDAVTVGFVLHSAKLDGAGRSFLELLDGLPGAGVRPVVTLPADGPMRAAVVRAGAPVAVVPYRWWLDRGTPLAKRAVRSAWNTALALPLAARLRRCACRVVVTNTMTVATGALAARLVRLPHVWHVHELWGGETGFEFDLGERLAVRLADRLSSLCIAASRAVADHLVAAGVTAAKVRVIHQAVTVSGGSTAVPRPADALVCVVVGSLIPLKRQADAIRAVAEVAARGVACELWLAGPEAGGYGRDLRALATATGAPVRFLGAVADAAAVVKAADVVLSCSAVEGFGRTVVEGMLLGKPVVAAAAGAVVELVEPGVTGLLFPPGDVDALAGHLTRLAGSAEERRRLGEAARSRTEGAFTRRRYAGDVAAALAPLARGRTD